MTSRTQSLESIFALIDTDDSGFIEKNELIDAQRMLSKHNAKFDEVKCAKSFVSMDKDKTGKITKKEFVGFYAEHPKFKKMNELEFEDKFVARFKKFLGRKKAIVKVFQKYDEDKNGSLDSSEISEMLHRSRGGKVRDKTVKKLIKEMHGDAKDGKVTQPEFVDYMFKHSFDLGNIQFNQRMEATMDGFRLVKLRNLFNMYDRDGNDTIEINEFATMMRNNGVTDPAKIIKKFTAMDVDKDRHLTHLEFDKYMLEMCAKLSDDEFKKAVAKMMVNYKQK